MHSMELFQYHGRSWAETGMMEMLQNEVEVGEMTIKSKITHQYS